MKNREENSTYNSMDKESQGLIGILTKRGILGNPAITDEKARAVKQRKDRLSYHNTLQLLQNYRTLVWVMECFPETVAEEPEQPFRSIDELLEQMDLQLVMGNRRMETQLESTKKTRILLDRINEYRLGMSSRNYYRLRQQAITILSIQLWPAPAGDVDFWLEMLTFLESIQ